MSLELLAAGGSMPWLVASGITPWLSTFGALVATSADFLLRLERLHNDEAVALSTLLRYDIHTRYCYSSTRYY